MSLGFGFILKKIISALLMPLSIGLILAIIGLWYLHKNNSKRAKVFITISIIWSLTISSLPFSNLIIEPLESRYSKLENIPKGVKYILLLGGDKEYRAWEALRLYNKIPNAKIITSGYSAVSGNSGAKSTAKLLESIGVKKSDILMQILPKDTQEEVIEIKKRLKDIPFIVVTSAYQMPRAMMMFKKYGLDVTPAPTDFKVQSEDIFPPFPKAKHLLITTQAWHEYIGLLWFFLKNP